MNTIELYAIDSDGYEACSPVPFNTLKEARAFVKETAMDAGYWDRKAESAGWASRNVDKIQIRKDGAIVNEYYPEFVAPADSQVAEAPVTGLVCPSCLSAVSEGVSCPSCAAKYGEQPAIPEPAKSSGLPEWVESWLPSPKGIRQ